MLLRSFGDGCKKQVAPLFLFGIFVGNLFSPIFDSKLQEIFVELRGKVAALLNEVGTQISNPKHSMYGRFTY